MKPSIYIQFVNYFPEVEVSNSLGPFKVVQILDDIIMTMREGESMNQVATFRMDSEKWYWNDHLWAEVKVTA